MEGEGTVGWEEIVDSQLNGIYDVHELHDMASLAFKCINEVSKSRPPIRNIAQELSQFCKKHSKNHNRTSPIESKEVSIECCSKELHRLHSR